ncbi:hypothetical protein FACS189428_7890 [Clostridia bacterium]|nr:hypothetical protein FACS189428_7890 [Clostridia bacterium]
MVVGDDDECGTIAATKSITTTISAAPITSNGGPQSLYLYKTSKASYLLAGTETEYQMIVQNIGAMVTSDVYVVDIIPAKSSFVAAYTTATTNAESYSCAGCQVFFSKTNANLPKKFDPSNPFTPAMIQSYFTKGSEVNGVWSSPFGSETKYVAYLVDDTTKTPPIFPTGGERKV